MSSVNLSLDEIIAKTRATKKGRGGDSSFKSDSVSGRRNGGGGGGAQRRTGGGGFRSAGGAFSKSVPGGKWRHDKFEQEGRGGGAGGRGARASSPRGGVLASAVNANKKVRLNVSNLAVSVTTADLEELFAPFNVDSAAVHYAEAGEHLGTGDVVLKRRDALKALTEFAGVSVDGKRLEMAIVEGGTGRDSIFDRVQVVKKVAGGGIQKRSRDAPVGRGQQNRRQGGGDRKRNNDGGRHPLDRFDEDAPRQQGGRGGAGGRAGGRNAKPKSEAELDAELDAYMKKPTAMES